MSDTYYYCSKELHQGVMVKAKWLVRNMANTVSYSCCADHLDEAVRYVSSPARLSYGTTVKIKYIGGANGGEDGNVPGV